VRQGDHFLGAAHTLERFRTCFYRPLVSTTENFERWTGTARRDTAARASELVETLLGEYEQPPIDDGVLAGIDEYVDRRRRELGD
jgi:trimethylamine---corrinoid protein Co-methyltransferase